MKRILYLSLCILFLAACNPTAASSTATPFTTSPSPRPTLTPAPTTTYTPEANYPVFQAGNENPKTHIQPKRSEELEDNRIGLYIHGLPAANSWDPNDWLDPEVFDLGVKRMRFAINELDIGMVDWSTSEFRITQGQNEFINDLADQGIISTYVLTFWDKANHPTGWPPGDTRFKTETDVERYLEFVRFIVQNVEGSVQYYEIWNEPDVGDPRQRIEIPEYINLVQEAVPVIHDEYRNAKIIVAVAGTGDPPSRDYLYQLIQSDEIMPLVDVISWHPFYDTSPEYQTDYYYGYEAFVQQIKDLSSEHGFQGEYFATEITQRSVECDYCNDGLPKYPNIVAAKYYARGIMMNLGMDVTVGVGGMSSTLSYSFPTVQNICTVMEAAMPVELPFTIESDATTIKHYAFVLPNGAVMVVLWNDVTGVENDPGVNADLSFTGVSAQSVTGIDVIYGFEQQLVSETTSDGLDIHGVMLKDYPIFIRFNDDVNAPVMDLQAPANMPFSGEWEGTDPDDGSAISLFLTQVNDGLAGRYNDNFRGDANTPGLRGDGFGLTTSDTTAPMNFVLMNADGNYVNLSFDLRLSNQNNTLTLSTGSSWSTNLQRR